MDVTMCCVMGGWRGREARVAILAPVPHTSFGAPSGFPHPPTLVPEGTWSFGACCGWPPEGGRLASEAPAHRVASLFSSLWDHIHCTHRGLSELAAGRVKACRDGASLVAGCRKVCPVPGKMVWAAGEQGGGCVRAGALGPGAGLGSASEPRNVARVSRTLRFANNFLDNISDCTVGHVGLQGSAGQSVAVFGARGSRLRLLEEGNREGPGAREEAPSMWKDMEAAYSAVQHPEGSVPGGCRRPQVRGRASRRHGEALRGRLGDYRRRKGGGLRRERKVRPQPRRWREEPPQKGNG